MASTMQVPVEYMVPDSSGNAYASLLAGTNIRGLFPAFAKDVDSQWWGKVRVPQDYSSTPTLICRVGANSTLGRVTTFLVASIVLDTTVGWDAAALTAEAAQNQTLSTTAYRPSDITFSLSTTPSAGSDLVFYVEHNGTAAADTLAVDSLLFATVFQYTST